MRPFGYSEIEFRNQRIGTIHVVHHLVGQL